MNDPKDMRDKVPERKLAPANAAPPLYRTTYGADYLLSGDFDKDVDMFELYADRKTGFAYLDEIQPLYPGLYVIGATSGLGKTTFIYQLVDQIAEAGQHVIYFALEQSRSELICKSLARGFFQRWKNGDRQYPTPSSTAIRTGIARKLYPDQLREQVYQYVTTIGNNVMIVDQTFNMTVENVVKVVDEYVAVNHVAPVVVVDYLQIVQATLVQGRQPDAKSAMDHTIHEIKLMQAKYGNAIIGISSLNRTSYLNPVDFEAYKESGIIEYSCDVVWGLQLSLMDTEEYRKLKGNEAKRKKVREALNLIPRACQLTCLKNRFGRSHYTLTFDYYTNSDCFVDVARDDEDWSNEDWGDE